MNPYARFGLLSNTVSAALIVGGLAVFGAPVFEAITSTAGGSGPAMWGALGGSVVVLVVFWLAMTEAIFPTLFRFNMVRKLVLGKYYIEGTWLQAERGSDKNRMAVIDVQPDGKSFIFSGYALNEDLEIESNTLIEFSKFEWPFMTYKFRNSLSDGGDGQREGVGELQFEMNKSSARRYNGYAQSVKTGDRMKIEGNKLTSGTEVKRLRSLEGRQKIFEKYWELFFNASIRKPAATAPVLAPLQKAVAPLAAVTATRAPHFEDVPPHASDERPVVDEMPAERRSEASAPSEGSVVPRRRASDWAKDEPAISKKSEPEADVGADLGVEAEDISDKAEEKATGTDAAKSGRRRSRPRRY